MAIIGKLQSNRILVVGFIAAALALFILSMYFTQGGGDDLTQESKIGTVNGVGMDMSKYETYKKNAEQNIFYGKYNQAKTDDERRKIIEAGISTQDEKQAATQAFSFLAQTMLLKEEYKKLGLNITDDEFESHLYGGETFGVHPYAQSFFRDSTGQFNEALIDQFLNSEEDGAEERINNFNEDFRSSLIRDKYSRLIGLGGYVTKLEAKKSYELAESKRNIRVVVKKFNDVTKDMEITEEQLKSFYESHKEEKVYEQKEGVVLNFTSVPVTIVQEDVDIAKNNLAKLSESFAKSENDSLFSTQRTLSEMARQLGKTQLTFPTSGNATPKNYPLDMDEKIQGLNVGDVFGPYQVAAGPNAEMILAKVQSIDLVPQASVRHILIKATGSEEILAAGKRKADSIATLLKAGANFDALEKEFNEDPGSVQNQGHYKWFDKTVGFVQEFKDFGLNGNEGDIDVVKTSFGFHVMKITGRREAKVPTVFTVSNKVVPSEASLVKAEEVAYSLRDKLEAAPNDFDTIVKEMELAPKQQLVYMETAQAPSFGNAASKVLNFVLNKGSEAGDCRIINDGKQLFVVSVKKKLKEGIPDYEDVKERMRYRAKNSVAAEKLKKEMAGFTNLDELAGKMGLEVKTAEVSLKESNIPQVGNEPKVVGALFSNIKEGKLTTPLEGNSGVYVVEVVKVIEPAATTDYTKQLDELKSVNTIDAIYGNAMNGLYEKFKPVDNRMRSKYNGE